MLDTLFGLPTHPLIVHATVVIVPAAALTVTVAALWPPFRMRAGPLPLVLALTAPRHPHVVVTDDRIPAALQAACDGKPPREP